MFIARPGSFARATAIQPRPAALTNQPRARDVAAPARGLPAGTLVETVTGWIAVERLGAGDLVQTLDGGLRPVRHVTRHAATGAMRIRIPSGALQNDSALALPPGQEVMVDGPVLERLFDLPVARVRAADLIGLHGISVGVAGPGAALVELGFDEEEMVWANGGLCLFCPAASRDAAAVPGFFQALSPAQARLVNLALRAEPAETPLRRAG